MAWCWGGDSGGGGDDDVTWQCGMVLRTRGRRRRRPHRRGTVLVWLIVIMKEKERSKNSLWTAVVVAVRKEKLNLENRSSSFRIQTQNHVTFPLANPSRHPTCNFF